MRGRFDQCWSTDAAECPTFTSLLREYAGETRPLAKEINPAINHAPSQFFESPHFPTFKTSNCTLPHCPFQIDTSGNCLHLFCKE